MDILKFLWQLAILFITPLVTYMVCHAVWLSPVDKSLRIGLVAMADPLRRADYESLHFFKWSCADKDRILEYSENGKPWCRRVQP